MPTEIMEQPRVVTLLALFVARRRLPAPERAAEYLAALQQIRAHIETIL